MRKIVPWTREGTIQDSLEGVPLQEGETLEVEFLNGERVVVQIYVERETYCHKMFSNYYHFKSYMRRTDGTMLYIGGLRARRLSEVASERD